MIQIEKTGPVMLLILDGFGYSEQREGNAIAHAHMPTYDMLLERYPHTFLKASGRAVGLPDGFMGNSEVGHLCIGAGRVIRTPLCKFHDSIDDGSFFDHELFKERCKGLRGKSLHILALLSDAGVHSHEKHVYAMLRFAKQHGVARTFVHAFLDGRDTEPYAGKAYVKKLLAYCDELGYGELASLHGRFFAMDRDKNWDRVQKSYDVITGSGEVCDWEHVIDAAYKAGISDEFVEPCRVLQDGAVQEGDGIVFLNVRPDRAQQLTTCFIDPSFGEFATIGTSTDGFLSFFVSTVRYKQAFTDLANDVLFEDEAIQDTLLDVIDKKRMFVIAETEKYAHVTYFFRGKRDEPGPYETRILVPSLKVKSYVDHPCMSADKITAHIVDSFADPYDFYLVNYANGDMVGHSGDFDATVKACECVDVQLKVLYDTFVRDMGGTIFLTADHGNAEEMRTPHGVKTSHTKNPVPFVIISDVLPEGVHLAADGGLCNIAATVLLFLGVESPEQMSKSLV